jgi:hypothetical protein
MDATRRVPELEFEHSNSVTPANMVDTADRRTDRGLVGRGQAAKKGGGGAEEADPLADAHDPTIHVPMRRLG